MRIAAIVLFTALVCCGGCGRQAVPDVAEPVDPVSGPNKENSGLNPGKDMEAAFRAQLAKLQARLEAEEKLRKKAEAANAKSEEQLKIADGKVEFLRTEHKKAKNELDTLKKMGGDTSKDKSDKELFQGSWEMVSLEFEGHKFPQPDGVKITSREKRREKDKWRAVHAGRKVRSQGIWGLERGLCSGQ
jgi:hypothetical protein